MEDIIEQVRQLVREVERKVDELRQGLDRVLSRVPAYLSWVADRIREGWSVLQDKIGQFFDWMGEKLAYAGSPGALADAAKRWQTEVAGAMSQALDRSELGALAVDDRWQGEAADQYRQKIPGQRAAMTSVQARAGQISASLDSLHLAIYVFWGAVAVAVGALVGGIVGALASTATILGAPAGPFIAAAAVVAALIAVGAGTVNLNAQADSASLKLQTAISTGTQDWPSFALS